MDDRKRIKILKAFGVGVCVPLGITFMLFCAVHDWDKFPHSLIAGSLCLLVIYFLVAALDWLLKKFF